MATDAELRRLKRFYKQSVQALPITVAFTVVLGGVLVIVSRWLAIPAWIVWIVVEVGVLSVVGETINIVYLRRKLRGAKGERGRG